MLVLCVIFGPSHLTECTGSWDPHMLAELGWGYSLAGGVPAAAAGEILHRTQIIAVGVDCGDLLRGAHKNWDLYSACKATLRIF